MRPFVLLAGTAFAIGLFVGFATAFAFTAFTVNVLGFAGATLAIGVFIGFATAFAVAAFAVGLFLSATLAIGLFAMTTAFAFGVFLGVLVALFHGLGFKTGCLAGAGAQTCGKQ